MEYFELLRYRKSTRRFTGDQVSPERLADILAAANITPVGSNFYKDVHLTVVQDRGVLDKLAEAAIKRKEIRLAEVKEISKDTADPALEQKKYDPFYGAPTVIFVSHKKQDLQPGIEFANVALLAYSMHLAATDLGLGSVIMWFALESMRQIPEFDHTDLLNLPEGFEPLTGLAVGHPLKALAARAVKTDRLSINYL